MAIHPNAFSAQTQIQPLDRTTPTLKPVKPTNADLGEQRSKSSNRVEVASRDPVRSNRGIHTSE